MLDNHTLVILPGWGGSKETWKEFIEIADSDFNVLCIDLPCFGEEQCPEAVWGVEDFAEFVKNRLNRINDGSTEFVVLGHSFGGQVAAYLAARNSDLVSKLVLSGAAVFRPKRRLKRSFFAVVAKIGKAVFSLPIIRNYDEVVRKLLYKLLHSPDYLGAGGIKKEIFKKVIRQDISELLSKISIPTLIVWGTRDKYVPLRHGKKIAKLIKGSELRMIKNGRHGLHLQDAENLYNIVKNFSTKD